MNIGANLKYAYQQFCKQDGEEREFSRQLLIKLHKFEAKSAELASRTHIAQQMKNQFERVLMQQNPLLWAQIQRGLAEDLDSRFESHQQPVSIHNPVCMKDMAINTDGRSSTSSEQSLQEDGVWPHTPSPHPDLPPTTAEQMIYLENKQQPTIDESNDHKRNFPVASTLETQMSHSFAPDGISTPNITSKHYELYPAASPPRVLEATCQIKQHNLIKAEDLINQQQSEVNKEISREEIVVDGRKSVDTAPIAEATINPVVNPVTDVRETKPFRLDSESSETAAVSGPISGQKADDGDSDSFWN